MSHFGPNSTMGWPKRTIILSSMPKRCPEQDPTPPSPPAPDWALCPPQQLAWRLEPPARAAFLFWALGPGPSTLRNDYRAWL